jgi:FkbM family methyltransferase
MLKLIRTVWTHPLNVRGGRMAALWRVLRWQIASRLMPGPIGLPFVDGTWLFARRGMTGATGNWYCGLLEASEMAFVLHLLRPGERFVDVGANVGSYTILAAGAAKAEVVAVEPIPSTFESLQRNVALNALDERGAVTCHRLGLSDTQGRLRFTSGFDTVNHVVSDGEEAPSIGVPVTRMDDLLDHQVPSLIKIDVEGHELAVLRGAHRALGDPRLLAVIMETNGSGERYGVPDEALHAEMRGHGFAPYGYDPIERSLIAASRSNGNTVFVRDPVAVGERVKAAPTFQLVNGTI